MPTGVKRSVRSHRSSMRMEKNVDILIFQPNTEKK